MNPFRALMKETFMVPCVVEIEHSAHSLHAHVQIDGEFVVRPGDEVFVHDAPASVPYGSSSVTRCMATVTRAGIFERVCVKFAGFFELTELYDVSFSARGKL
jgi:hypothetical protein